MQNAINILKADHRIIRELFEELGKTTSRSKKRRMGLLQQIESELAVHTMLEEDIFYPAIRQMDGVMTNAMYCAALEQHHEAVGTLLPDLIKTDIVGPGFSDQARALKDMLLTHIEDEENKILPMAQNCMPAAILKELGARLRQRRNELTTPPVENE